MDQDRTKEGYVNSTTDEKGITRIGFYHPAHNSLPGALLAKLAGAIRDAGKDPATKVIVLGSAGDRSFCAGASFDELISIGDFETGKRFFMGFANVINACRTCGKIIVGRVQGKTVGGGVGLASATDYCMATKYASVRLSELAVGIGPFVVGPAVERKVGLSAMSQMSLNPDEWQTAAWAKEKGLFAEVFETTDQLDAYIVHFTEKLAGYNPEALAELKKVFWQGTEHWDTLLEERAGISGKLVLSDFTRKAINAFKGK